MRDKVGIEKHERSIALKDAEDETDRNLEEDRGSTRQKRGHPNESWKKENGELERRNRQSKKRETDRALNGEKRICAIGRKVDFNETDSHQQSLNQVVRLLGVRRGQ
jgi:hypothetical protein